MPEFFQKLFSADFMAHGHCYFWRPEIVWLHVTSDALTALAYFAIPFALVSLVRRRNDLAFTWMFLLFGLFIMACGMTHVMSIWTLWHPVYRLEGLIKAVTAMASLPTAFLLLRLVPQAVALPSPQQLTAANRLLEQEVADRKSAERRVMVLNDELEARVAARTQELEAANQQLRARTAELEALLTHAPIGFAFFDRRHRYTRINQTLTAINGLPEEAHIGQPLSQVLPANAPFVDPVIENVFATGVAVETEIAGETPKEPGVTRHWLTGFYPILAEDRQVSSVGAFVIEISDRKRAEDAALLLSAIVSSSEDAIISKDLSGLVTSWNAGAERLFGYSASEAIGQPITLIIPPDRMEEELIIIDKLRRGEPTSQLPTLRRHKNGNLIDVSVTSSPVIGAGGKILGASKIVRDITQTIRNEKALRETAGELRVANDDLNQFAYAAAHDLREPLRNVRAYSELLVKAVGESSGENITRMANIARMKDIVAQGVMRMDDLLTDLLEYTRLSAEDEKVHDVDAALAAERAIQNLQSSIDASGAEISVGPLPHVSGHEQHYLQLFQNLIGNAIKYRDAGPLTITVSAVRQKDEWLFSVRDNGIGIPPQYQEKIFGLFKRLHGRDIPGTGIGLAICQKIVNRYQGRIWVLSEPGKGAEFLFTIPVL